MSRAVFVVFAALLAVAVVSAVSSETSGFRKSHPAQHALHPHTANADKHANAGKAKEVHHAAGKDKHANAGKAKEAHHATAKAKASTVHSHEQHAKAATKHTAMPAAAKHTAKTTAPSVHHASPHNLHKVLADLEREEAAKKEATKAEDAKAKGKENADDVEVRVIKELKKEVKMAVTDMNKLQQSFNQVRSELEVMEGDLGKVPMPAFEAEDDNLVQENNDGDNEAESKAAESKTVEGDADAKANDASDKDEDKDGEVAKDSEADKDGEAAKDDDKDAESEIALLEMPIDEMNEGLADDDSSAPLMMPKAMRRQLLVQHAVQKPDDDEGVTFGLRGEGSGNTFDVNANGDPVPHPMPSIPADMVKPNDVAYRVDPNDPSLAGVAVADVDPAMTVSNNGVPGTGGKQLALSSISNQPPKGDDMMCVCKRQGAPRGIDRIRCKKHPSPTPTPTPVPVEIEGIIQCANGTWSENAGSDSGVKDTICISFPAKVDQPPPPEQEEQEEREYPPECYDERNEFVTDAVRQQRDAEGGLMILLEGNAGHCNCNA